MNDCHVHFFSEQFFDTLGRQRPAGSQQSAAEVVSADLEHLYLGHLSSDCNRPSLAHATLARRMEKVGATHVQLEAASQDVPSATFSLDHTCRGQQELQL